MTFKDTNEEEDDSWDVDELALITKAVVENYQRFRNQRKGRQNYTHGK